MNNNTQNKIIIIILAAILVLIGFFNSMFIVYENQQAIVTQFGKVVNEKILTPGLHFKIPGIQNVLYFDRRIMNLNPTEREMIAKDQKRCLVESYAKYKIIDPLKFYRTVRTESNLALRVNPIIESKIREQVGKVILINLISRERENSEKAIQETVANQTKEYGIEIVDVKIKRIDLPKNNALAIFERMKSEREKNAAEILAKGKEQYNFIKASADKNRIILLSESDKKSSILHGEADSEVINLYNKMYQQDYDFFVFMKYMETYKDSINGKDTYLVLSNSENSDFFKLFNKF